MPDIGPTVPPDLQRARALRGLSDIAAGALEQRLWLEAGARILAAARRAGPLAAGVPGRVGELAAAWDDRAVTALEFAEALHPAELSAMVAEAPGWARAVLARAGAPA